jgi:hypothetical protein
MRTVSTLLALAASVFCAGVTIAADERPRTGGITKLEDASPVMYGRSAKTRATVEAIDLQAREISLKVPKGHVMTLRVENRVRNLAAIRKGDEVNVRYNQSVAMELRKLTEGEMPAPQFENAALTSAAAPDAQPSVVLAEVEAVSPREKTVFLKDADGRIRDVYVRDPKVLASVTAGDQVIATLTPAAVVSLEVQDPKKKKK